MKKTILLLLSALILLSGCATKPAISDRGTASNEDYSHMEQPESPSETDLSDGEQPEFPPETGENTVQPRSLDANRNVQLLFSQLCEGEKAYYFRGNLEKRMIWTVDKATGLSFPFCAKPECEHNDLSCNARLESFGFGLNYYDGKVFWITSNSLGGGRLLYSANQDGTGREVVRSFESGEPINNLTGNPQYLMHRGYLFASGQNHKVQNAESSNAFVAYAYDLSKPDAAPLDILGDLGAYGLVQEGGAQPYGDNLYLFSSPSDFVGEKTSRRLFIWRWDLNTRELITLFDGTVDFIAKKFWVTDDEILFSAVEESNIYALDLSSGEMALKLTIADPVGPSHYFSDHKLFEFGLEDNYRVIAVYDLNGNELMRRTLTELPRFQGSEMYFFDFCGCDGTQAWIMFYRMDNKAGDEYLAAIPLDGSEARVVWTNAIERQ